MVEEIEYHRNKRPDRTYISKVFGEGQYRMRMVSKVVEADERHEFATIEGEQVIVIKPGERQEFLAVFYEDGRKIKRITLQRFDTTTSEPIKQSFTFREEDIEQFDKALQAIRYLDLDTDEKYRIDDELIDARFVSPTELRRFIAEHPEIVQEIVRNDITATEVVALGYRKQQLHIFEQLTNNESFFAGKKQEWGKRRDEDVWQHFFEMNTWIFGHGLDYIFRSSLDDKRLEQVTSGHSVDGAGKRVDALMKSRGALSILCFVELKTHETPLMERNPRSECWSISNEVADAIAQVQKTVHKAVHDIRERLELTDDEGFPSGEVAYLCQPKSYVIIGSLKEFVGEHGANQEQFTSFELFRRQCIHPEIISFDELLERARFIVCHNEREELPSAVEPAKASPVISDDDLPF